jgi:hypothetical protein
MEKRWMMKTIVLLFLFTALLNAETLRATYEVSYGLFDRLGTAEATFETREDNTYTIRIEARTDGIARVLTNNRIETYESHGRIQNGLLIPQKYIKIRRTDSKKMTKIYTFDHTAKTVWRENIQSDEWEKVQNEFYAPEDLLSLFFNVKNHMKESQDRAFYAIGGNTKDGRIDVLFPTGDDRVGMQEKLQMENGEFIKVILNNKIFSSARGELLINLGSDALCDKAILEDVLFFGDIVGKRIK